MQFLSTNLNDLLKLWSRWRNLFYVTMKHESKRREGSRQIRRHMKKGRTNKKPKPLRYPDNKATLPVGQESFGVLQL